MVRAIGSNPEEPFSPIYVTLISALNSAESEILLTNAYFVPDPQLMKALTDAVARGVDVKLIVPSTTDSSLVFHAGRSHYEPLLRGGVKIYERRSALLHAKTAVIDGVWSTVGSTNLDWRSFLHNQELTAVILGSEFGVKMRAAFERDLADSDQITLEAWERRPCQRSRQGNVRSPVGVLAMSMSSRHVARRIVVGLAIFVGVVVTVSAQDAGALKARYAALQDKLATNQFGRPLVLESKESSDDLKGDVYAVVDHPFATVQQALQSTEHWCDILILHLNVKRCRAGGGAGQTLSLNVGRKFDQPIEDAYALEFAYRVVATTPDYLQVQLTAEEGPLSTRNYRIVVEASPVDAKRTVIHMSYAYGYGFTARMAMKTYLATIGSQKVGFTIVDRRDGKPVYQGGVLGLLERNTMRYYLAIDAYLSAYALPAAEQSEKRIREWYASTERYAEQLHEMEQAEYLEMKRKEIRRQQGG